MTSSIQKKIWILALVVLGIMALIWIALTFYNQKTQDQYNRILQRYLTMNEAADASQQLVAALNNYRLSPILEYRNQLQSGQDSLLAAKHNIQGLRNAENDFELSNYVHLIDSLIETANRSLLFGDAEEPEISEKAFSEATRLSMYVSEMTLTLIDKELKTYDRFYWGIIEQSEALKRLGIWLLLLITFLLLLFTHWFSSSITRPVLTLIQAAKQLSRGRFDLKIEVATNDEMSFLAKTFDRMRVNINNLIQEIQEKAQLEKELQDNRLLLKESQLRSLQSQINPHFLFNTLDTISKKAYLEGSEETSDLLVSVANLLRYNLKRLDRPVTLSEEVNVLQQYIEIQKARFAERVRFHADIDESCLQLQMPGLTLQPIVENAIIHAVEPREEGGVIWFRVTSGPERVTVEIADDGPGMAAGTVQGILDETEVEAGGHSTGIGFGNVVKRLRLFYGISDVVEIESGEQPGTRILLKLPKTRRGEGYV